MMKFASSWCILKWVCIIGVLVKWVSANSEGDALFALKKSLIDPDHVLESWDPNLVNPCTYFHITCNSDNHVTRIDLGNTNLSGHLVPDLGKLEHLQYLELIQSKSVDFSTLDESPLDKMLTNATDDGHLYGVNGSSGGYAETVFRHAAKSLYGRDIEGPVNFRTLRNTDFREVSLEVEGKTVLRFALCYGFRNLQNFVRKIKNGNCDYHFLEIMACPSGCLNGGGQIKPKAGQSAKDLIQHLENVSMSNVIVADPFENPIVKGLYAEWLDQPGSENAKRYVHTQYHPVVKSVTSQLQNW